jgi:hypothetical protein
MNFVIGWQNKGGDKTYFIPAEPPWGFPKSTKIRNTSVLAAIEVHLVLQSGQLNTANNNSL